MQRKWGIKKIAETLRLQKKSHAAGQHSCDSTLKKVMLALDNEMSVEEEKKFLEEINSCSRCLEKFNIEQEFKKYLSEKIKRHACTTNLAEQIRASIQTSTDR